MLNDLFYTIPQPTIIERSSEFEDDQILSFENIDDVPTEDIIEILCEQLRKFGATERDDLIRQIALKLGFQRSGHRIRARASGLIDHCISQGRLQVQESSRIQLT